MAQAVQVGHLDTIPSSHATGKGTVLPELQRGWVASQGRGS